MRLPVAVDGGDVVLRRWTADDAPALVAARDRSAEHLARWTPGMFGDLTDVPVFLAEIERSWVLGRFAAMAITVGGEVAGYCSAHRERPPAAEIGYWVRADLHGRGIATRAVGLLVDAAFVAWPDLDRLTLGCHPANAASIAVARRSGFVLLDDAGAELRWERRRR